jgi:hypothetical protein
MAATLGERFARSIADKNADQLLDLFASSVDFRAVTPGKFWETEKPEELVNDMIFGHWFEAKDVIQNVERIETGNVVNVERVGYTFRITNPEGEFLVEQQAYLKTSDDQINYLRIVCSGYQPLA